MEREAVRNLFGKNFIGKDELKPFFRSMGLGDVDVHEKPIEYSDSDLIRAAESGYILIYGIEETKGGFYRCQPSYSVVFSKEGRL